MKRRILIITLVLVLAMTMLVPGAALAKNDKCNPGGGMTDFSGSGLIYVTCMPDPVIKGKIWRYDGEIVEGFLAQCDWDLLAGTVFWSEHDSVVRVDDQGNANGIMKGTFSLARPDGSGVLEGTFTGHITGNLFTGEISDSGVWVSNGGTGVFEGVKASGKWSAQLSIGPIPGTDIYTLIGPVTWEGKYKLPAERPISNKFWKQDKPEKPFKPWKVVRPD
jgi:hypothetical protein